MSYAPNSHPLSIDHWEVCVLHQIVSVGLTANLWGISRAVFLLVLYDEIISHTWPNW